MEYPNGKRYYPYAQYLRQRYGGRVAKIPLDGGFTCPNRDGTKGIGGCAYCSARGSGDFVCGDDLEQQFSAYAAGLTKWQPVGYIPYFQAFTGTYAPLERLRTLYDRALALPDAVGLSVATRPDCVPEEVADLLAEYAQRTDVTVELGVQTVHDRTARAMNLCHTFADFERALERLQKRDIPVCVHLINGLPGETREDMVESARTVGGMGIQSVKLHLLHILKHTALSHLTEADCLSMEDYVGLVCDQLEVIPPEVVIQRLTGDGKGADLIAPQWSRNKRAVLNAIDREMARRDAWQGDRREG